jgi:hypothetical protein
MEDGRRWVDYMTGKSEQTIHLVLRLRGVEYTRLAPPGSWPAFAAVDIAFA